MTTRDQQELRQLINGLDVSPRYLTDRDGTRYELGVDIPGGGGTGGTDSPTIYVPDQYDNFQAAIDAAPDDGAEIVYDISQYIGENESLPITVDKPITFRGVSLGDQLNDGLDFTSNTTDNVFEIDVTENWRIQVSFKDMKVRGGRDIINLVSPCMLNVERCYFEDADRDGIHQSSTGEGLYTNVNNTIIQQCRDGLNFADAQTTLRPNALSLNHVVSRSHSRHGAYLKGAGCRTVAGSYEDNGEAGIVVGDGSAKTTAILLGPYFEKNGQTTSDQYDADVVVQPGSGSDKGAVILGANQSPASASTYGIHIYEGQGSVVAHSAAYTGGANVTIGSDTTDAQVWTAEPMTVSVNASATRPRLNGLALDSANAETPTASEFQPGDFVEWTDTGDASGDGVYLLSHDGSTWVGPL